MALTNLGKLRYHTQAGNTEPVFICAHSAAPNDGGTTNRIGAPLPCVFAAADAADAEWRYLDGDVELVVGTATQFTHYSVYNSANECLHIVALATSRSLEANDKIVFKGTGSPRMGISIN